MLTAVHIKLVNAKFYRQINNIGVHWLKWLINVFKCFLEDINNLLKGALSGLRRFLATESPLNMMKTFFCFISKALFVLKIFKFFS